MAGAFELKKKELKRTPDADEKKKAGLEADPSKGGKSRTGAGNGGTAPGESESAGGDVPNDSGSAPDGSGKGPSRKKKILFIAAGALGIVAISSVLLLVKFGAFKKPEEPVRKLEPITSIKRPIPIPDYREMLDFVVLYEIEGQKTMTAFRMELAFHSPSRYQSFKEQNVIFRDAVYAFLQKQNSSRNTSRSWHSVVEKELFDYIRVKMPHSQADAVKLTQVENL